MWDYNRALPVVIDDGTLEHFYGLGLLASRDGSSNITYYMTDGLGSVTNLIDDDDNVTDSYTYDVFGAIRSHTGSSANPWLFTGQQQDADSGLYYLRARYYEPETGRWTV